MNSRAALVSIKALHTIVWAFFVGCIVGIPVAAYLGSFLAATVFFCAVAGEVAVLALNRWSCPLTGLAARHTSRREANFDIFLPEWIARYNKVIFGSLFIAGSVYAMFAWWYASAR